MPEESTTIVIKSRWALGFFFQHLTFIASPPPQTMLVFGRSTYSNGKFSRAQQRQVSHRWDSIVPRSVGGGACKMQELKRWEEYGFLSRFCKCPKDFCPLLYTCCKYARSAQTKDWNSSELAPKSIGLFGNHKQTVKENRNSSGLISWQKFEP